MRYVVNVGGETIELDLDLDTSGDYVARRSDGETLRVQTLASRAGLVTVLVEGERVEVQPDEATAHYRCERFAVTVESGLERAAARTRSNAGLQSKQLLASMPGRVVRISCEPGQSVEAGAPLLVMEAMKMQNELCAKGAAVIAAIRVEVGQTVERGALLLEFE